MLEDSQLLLADLVEQSEVSIGPQADQLADLVADIFDRIVLSDSDDDGIIFE